MTQSEVTLLVSQYMIAIGVTGYPNSHVWMLVDEQMKDLDRHLFIVNFLKKAGLIEEKFDFLTLTPKGFAMHQKILEVITERALETKGAVQSLVKGANGPHNS